MRLNFLFLAFLLFATAAASGQSSDEINKTDTQGRKQGYWIKKYPNGSINYEGTFRDDKPVGKFVRYNSDKTVKSVLIYSGDSREADASIYHANGFIASRGRYVDQLKEGKWSFYSSSTKGGLINEEYYSKNIKNGPSLKYYPDSLLAEKIIYVSGVKNGEWLQFYPNGKPYLKTLYVNGNLDGRFETWYEDGKQQYSGSYKNNIRDGKWRIYAEDGNLKYELNYIDGVASNPQLEQESREFFEMIENNQGKIADPEKTGIIK